jgi:ATP-dependent DNA helicase RecG
VARVQTQQCSPEEIGEYISALANSAALTGKANAYIAWGIENTTHNIVGTDFSPFTSRIGGEQLENWILRLLSPKINFHFYRVILNGLTVVLLEISRASRQPVQFQNQEFIRIGSYKKKLKDFLEKERELWRIFDKIPFEDMVASAQVSSEDVLRLIDYPAYFDLLHMPLPPKLAGEFSKRWKMIRQSLQLKMVYGTLPI